MSLISQVEQDYIAAYKAKEDVRVAVLRLLKTAAKNRQVELMRPLTDDEMLEVIQKQAKQRQDSVHCRRPCRSGRQRSGGTGDPAWIPSLAADRGRARCGH